MLVLASNLASWSGASGPSGNSVQQAARALGARNRVHQTTAGRAYSPDGLKSALPTRLTGASCSAPGGIATLSMPVNPFRAGQWIAVRDVPLSERVAVTGEKVGIGNGSTTTFT